MITKVSQIEVEDIADYIRISELDETLKNELNIYLNVAKKFVKDETGLEDLDLHEDFIIAVYVLCQDMYDNKSLYVDKSNLNKVVDTILGRHRNNLL